MNQDVKQAVLILYINPLDNTEVLAVSRKDDHSKLGLPGGKVDDKETFLQALTREIKEELETDINPVKCEFLYQEKEEGFDTSTYLYTGKDLILKETPFINEEGALVTYAKVADLMTPLHSPFHLYNTNLFKNVLKQEIGI